MVVSPTEQSAEGRRAKDANLTLFGRSAAFVSGFARRTALIFADTPKGSSALKLRVFIGVMLTVGVIMFLRNPDPILRPAFYGEDPRWVSPLLFGDHWAAYLHARPDYLVLGQTMLLDASQAINGILFGLDVSNLPGVIAVVSYLFVGFLAAVSHAAMSRWLPWNASLAVVCGIALLPLGNSAAEVIGRVLNLGYLFYPLAVALLLVRPQIRTPTLRWICDAGLLICAMTNPLVIPLVLICMAVLSVAELARRRFPRREFLLSGALVLLCLYYISRFATAPSHDRGVPDLGNLIEALGARSFLYPFVFPFYESLNDTVVVALSLGLLAFVGWTLRRADSMQRSVGLFLSASTLLVIICVIALRPGLLGILSSYAHPFPDRYFQAQNIMVILTLAWAVGTLADMYRTPILAAMSAFYIWNAPFLFETAAPRLSIAVEGTFGQEVVRSLASGVGEVQPGVVVISTYPETWDMYLPTRIFLETAKAECERNHLPECSALPALGMDGAPP